jgi:hypothetical protein
VVELLAHLDHDGGHLAWPVAVVAESPDELSVVSRTYCSQWPLGEGRVIRRPILRPGQAHPGDVVDRYLAVLATGDTAAVVSTFAQDGISVGRSVRATRTGVSLSCGRSIRGASARAAASAWSIAR